MINNFFDYLFNNINLMDLVIVIILIYCVTQCFLKGFSLSLISFMKWIISAIMTIILVPKLQPIVSDYIESEFIKNIGLGVSIFFLTLFITIILGIYFLDVVSAIKTSAFFILIYYSITNFCVIKLPSEKRLYSKSIALYGLIMCVTLAATLFIV